ncbi:MAG: SigmaK-factor processing regulatory BofA [Oscillospiraceae bacterium]|jgi:hypothetical protein|nr:SigmaK-factor processing regulatory BofA [Oscillospiraceae bacterium]
MTISWVWALALAALMAGLFRLGRSLLAGRHRRALLHAALGVSALLLANAWVGGVAVNPVTLGLSGLLGVPGALLALALAVL